MNRVTGKVGRNNPCPCGSGKKYKRCCLARSGGDGAEETFSAEDRAFALEELECFVGTRLGREDDHAYQLFYAKWEDRMEEIDNLDNHWVELSESVYEMWFMLDYELPQGGCPADLCLERNRDLSTGVRRYVEALRNSMMRLYAVDDLYPGASLVLKDVLTGSRVTVKERLGSRHLHKYDLIAARIIDRGLSGLPEIEVGMLAFPPAMRQQVISVFSEWHKAYRLRRPHSAEKEFFKKAPMFFHEVWLDSILDPPIPRLKNAEGEELSITHVQFDVLKATELEAALDASQDLEREREGTAWLWFSPNDKGERAGVGRIVLAGDLLELECLSAQQGERGRALLEQLATAMILHRCTWQENLERILRDYIREERQREPDFGVCGGQEVRHEEEEAFFLDQMARHYRQWIDEPLPELDNHTPRDAARDPALRPKLVDLIHELEGEYHRNLKSGAPAYDPSWLWAELNLDDRSAAVHPPPLAHERLPSFLPGIQELCRKVAVQVRRRTGFKDACTILDADEIQRDAEIQRFLLEECGAPYAKDTHAGSAGETAVGLSECVRPLVNFEMHRRKIFWVDDSLAYMLAKTDLDVTGAEVRVPFPSFALVFTDRHTLSLAERMLSADRASRLGGYLLKVATVYVTEECGKDRRAISLTYAFDALGADPPHLSIQEIPLADNRPISHALSELLPGPRAGTRNRLAPELYPWHALVHLVINAILYATSAGVAPELRPRAALMSSKREPQPSAPPVFSSEDVYFLPGKIEISQVRRLQSLERVGVGRRLLHRFMVRGHWRHAPLGWKDQRVRWINPYWKGPDMAAVVERAYRLKP